MSATGATRADRAAPPRDGDARGAALVIALIVLASLVVIGGAFLTLALTETFIASNETRAAVAFAIAEGGLEHAVVELGDADVDDLLRRGGRLFVDEKLGNGRYSVVVSNNVEPEFPRGRFGGDRGGGDDDTDGVLVVTALGSFQGASRAVRALVEREDTVFDVAVLAVGGVRTRGAPAAVGTVRANGNVALSPETVVAGDIVAGGFVESSGDVSGKVVVGAPPRPVFDLGCPETEWGPPPEGPGVGFDPRTGDLRIRSGSEIVWPPGTSYFRDVTQEGEGAIRLAEDDRADIVVAGALRVGGAGFVNDNEASAFLQFWACGEDDREWRVELSAAAWMTVYAPRHRVRLDGDGTLHGSLIVGELDWRGAGRVDHDAGLAEDAPFAIVAGTWRELFRTPPVAGEDDADVR